MHLRLYISSPSPRLLKIVDDFKRKRKSLNMIIISAHAIIEVLHMRSFCCSFNPV